MTRDNDKNNPQKTLQFIKISNYVFIQLTRINFPKLYLTFEIKKALNNLSLAGRNHGRNRQIKSPVCSWNWSPRTASCKWSKLSRSYCFVKRQIGNVCDTIIEMNEYSILEKGNRHDL